MPADILVSQIIPPPSEINAQLIETPRLFSSTSTETTETKVTKETKEESKMAEVINPSGMLMSNGGGDGLFGGGGGLIGGLILGSILRNNGGLLGGDGAGAAALGAARVSPEQATANMSLMQAIGAVDKSVALNTAAFEASQATQSLGLTNQFNSTTASLAARVEGVKDVVNTNNVALMQGQNALLQNQMTSTAAINQNIMENRYELSRDINNDGDKTRALITAQYEAALNRQLSDANAAVIALQNRFDNAERSRGIEVTTTNNINQMQQQSQQQQQYGQLYNALWSMAQQIQNTNSAINVGSGTQTANPLNTNTNIR
jgi:hypothetical protein